jgi:hypothetical protein
MKKTTFGLLFVSVIILLSSCKGIGNIELKGVEKANFNSFENNMVHFTAGLIISNPSGVSFRVREVNLGIVANGDFIGTLHCDEDFKIKSRCDSVYMVPLSLQLGNIFTGAASLYKLSRQRQVKMEVKGYIRAKSFIVTKKIEISRSQVMDIPKF